MEFFMRPFFLVFRAAALLAIVGVSPSLMADETKPADVKAKTGLIVWDTGTPSKDALPSAQLAGKNDWTALAADQTLASFKGDAVLSNGRIAAVLRPGTTPRLEVYAVKANGSPFRGCGCDCRPRQESRR